MRGAAYRHFATQGALLREAGLENLIHAGYSRTARASPWPLHDHISIELHYFVRGALRCWIGGDLVDLRGGQVLIVRPSIVHGGWLGRMPPAELYWLGIHPWSPERGETAFGLSPAESSAIHDALRDLPAAFPAKGDLLAPLQRLVASYPPQDGRSLFALRAALLEILDTVIRAGRANAAPAQPARVKQAISLMSRTLEQPLSIPHIARVLGVGGSQFAREFRDAMGISPKDYYLRARILEACRRISVSQASVTPIAHALGFTSSQYFATAFKRIAGLTPTDYQRACLAPPTTEIIHWPA
jgi:AraC-like DNA-binding protein